MHGKRSFTFRLLALTLTVILIASCGTPTAAPPATEAPAPEVTEETAPTAKPAEIDVWFLSGSPVTNQMMEGLAGRYEELHPGVQVNFSTYSFDDLNNALKLALDSGTGPDVAYANPGINAAAGYALAGHLVELTDIVKEKGWDQTHGMDVLNYHNTLFDGKMYVVPYEMVAVGVFYNKTIFDELGLKPPETWEQFDTILADLKQKGYTPFSLGAVDGWTLGHYFYAIVHANTPFETIKGMFTLAPGYSYTSDSFVQAATILKEWVDKGYFNEAFLGASYDDQNNLFLTSQTAMNIGGTWNNSTFIDGADFEVGFFALPRVDPEIEWHSLYSTNNVWVISKYSENPEQAVDFLDFMMGEETAKGLWSVGAIPTYRFTTTPDPIAGLQLDVYQVGHATGIGYYFDDNMTEARSTTWAVLQAVAAGDVSPEEAMAAVEVEHAKAVQAASE